LAAASARPTRPTFVPACAGFISLAAVPDAFSRRIEGCSTGLDLKPALVLEALNMASTQRRPPRSIIPTRDRSAPVAFGLGCKMAGQRPWTGSVGNAYDNAMCESVFATLECELLKRQTCRSKAEARMAVLPFVGDHTTLVAATRRSATCPP
jgi:putative transposase